MNSPESQPEQSSDRVDESPLKDVILGEPLPYHKAVRDYLQTVDSTIWTWFCDNPAAADAEATKVELLKAAYRLDRDTHGELYDQADEIRTRMGLSAPVTLYQAQNVTQGSAFNVWMPGELHVVFGGTLREFLTTDEVSAVIAHEFAHFELFNLQGGDFLVTDAILNAMATDYAADSPHARTLRTYRLWTELFCDRRAAQVLGVIDDCVSTLVKLETGVKDVNPREYLKQAAEIMESGPLTSEGHTHPEVFIRAYSLACWNQNSGTADDRLKPIVEGPLALSTLDLLQQKTLVDLTHRFVRYFLNEEWIQTRLMVHHAQRFLDADASRKQSVVLRSEELPKEQWKQLRRQIEACDQELRKYFCYILLDFLTCDADLEEAPLAAGFLFCDRISLTVEFRDLVRKELKIGKRALQSVEANAEKIVQQMQQEVSA